ncbi:LysR substrate-binding domain-containing protein [Shimia sagamensis]|uniref:LysR family transcriptional regulator, hydrogen peroxide-inducible genes activator n=1 Tax=Shimia sagamensis TaxID=1566352 RepID=A0ABY1NZS2_9RHOB|nr:LysR substrate-binding domain-containing protein [Shimia sagamensis]SMP22904.1 LysR family transcriptional regulator, hydrogen peroxide-inducible genes activator [Shimia sagamensis]
MNNLTLRQLRYFDALAEHGHFGRAADVCAISQPALSVQIKDLEESFGAPLLERTTRRVRLTAFGEDVLVRVREILRSVDELGDMARAAQSGLTGRLRLGVIPTIAPYLLPVLLREIKTAFPDMALMVRETMTANLLAELHAGRIDTAIVALPVSEPAFAEVPLWSEEFVLVRPDTEATAPVPAPDTLERERLLLLEEGHCFRDQALSFCSLPTARPHEGLDGSSLSTLVQMVGAGLGVTVIPEMAISVDTPAAAVNVARFSGAQPARTIGMIWRKSSPLAAQLAQLSELVRDVGESL